MLCCRSEVGVSGVVRVTKDNACYKGVRRAFRCLVYREG